MNEKPFLYVLIDESDAYHAIGREVEQHGFTREFLPQGFLDHTAYNVTRRIGLFFGCTVIDLRMTSFPAKKLIRPACSDIVHPKLSVPKMPIAEFIDYYRKNGARVHLF